MIEQKYGTRKVVNFRGARKVVGGLTDQNKISVLLYISKEFGSVDKQEELFGTVINLCREIFECDNTTLRLFDGELLVPVKFIKETSPPRRNLEPGEGFSGATFASRKSLLIPDLTQTPEYLDPGESTRCAMCVPMLHKDEVMGTISVESDTEFFYKEDDLEILEALGSQLAMALTGVRLIEGLMTARAREAAVLNQLEWDLKMGRNVQSQIMPQNITPWNGIYFGTYYEPLVEVSGDYYDVVRQGNSVTIIIADVSGHGIPAALVTMAIHHQFQRCVLKGLGLTEIMEELGESVRPQLPESTYFTAYILRIYSDYTFAYVNGGHQKILHISRDGNIDELDTKGVPLGILEVRKTDYEEKQGKLLPGEYLMLLTDGYSEQKNKAREEIGVPRLKTWFLEEKTRLSKDGKVFVRDIVDGLVNNWRNYKDGANTGDDLAMLLLQCNHTIEKALPMLRSARLSHIQKNTGDAYSLALEAYKLDPSLKDNLLFLGQIYYHDANYQEAAKYFEEYILTSGEDTAITHFLLAKAYFKADRIAESKRSLKRSLVCDPGYTKSVLLLGRCYLKENSIPKAMKVLQQGIKSSPDNDALKTSLKRLRDLNSVKV